MYSEHFIMQSAFCMLECLYIISGPWQNVRTSSDSRGKIFLMSLWVHWWKWVSRITGVFRFWVLRLTWVCLCVTGCLEYILQLASFLLWESKCLCGHTDHDFGVAKFWVSLHLDKMVLYYYEYELRQNQIMDRRDHQGIKKAWQPHNLGCFQCLSLHVECKFPLSLAGLWIRKRLAVMMKNASSLSLTNVQTTQRKTNFWKLFSSS